MYLLIIDTTYCLPVIGCSFFRIVKYIKQKSACHSYKIGACIRNYRIYYLTNIVAYKNNYSDVIVICMMMMTMST